MNDMKPLERKFFRYCCKQIKYKPGNTRNDYFGFIDSMRYNVNRFIEKHNCSAKQLWYYLEKWSRFYNYGVCLDLGWFEFDKLPERYKRIVPNRTWRMIDKYGKMKGDE